MRLTDITDMIESIGLPFTYDFFPNNIAPNPPYIVFNYPDTNDFGADDTNYVKVNVLNIELYTATKDFQLENTVETVRNQNGFFYDKSEAYIRNENLYQISYVSQFTIKE